MINAAKKSGADVVKFQFFNSSSLVSKIAKKAPYQMKSKKDNEKQYKLLKSLELSLKNLQKIRSYCKKKKIGFMISIFDETGIKAIKELKTKYIKIPSGEINNYPLLKSIGKLRKNIILSTGMANYSEVDNALKILVKSGIKKKKITILQCNSSYPTPLSDVNLRVITEYQERFKVKVGYSDHTQGIESSLGRYCTRCNYN